MIIRKLIIDIETTGLNIVHDRIIELCALEMIDNQLTGNKLHLFFNPNCEMSEGAYQCHGISLSELQDKPTFAEKLKEIEDFLFYTEYEGNSIPTLTTQWIAHNINFDFNYIKAEFARCKKIIPCILQTKYTSFICTLELARKKLPISTKHSLNALCNYFDIDISQRNKHGALLDCQLLAQVYLQLNKLPTPLITRSVYDCNKTTARSANSVSQLQC